MANVSSAKTIYVSNPFGISYNSSAELVTRVKNKYSQIFDADKYIQSNFKSVDSYITNLNNVITSLKKLKSTYGSDSILSVDGQSYIPKLLDPAIKSLGGSKLSNDTVTGNLELGIQKMCASYYRKKKNDAERFIQYAESALNILSTQYKVEVTYSSMYKTISSYIDYGRKKKINASSGESAVNGAASYDTIHKIIGGSTKYNSGEGVSFSWV